MPLISYIIPSYNVPAHMLTACIDSILAIDLNAGERELIVIDDGSDVPCSEVLKGYDQSLLTIVRQENQGLSVARNNGIERASGEYIHFVDADDTLVQCAYNQCVKQLRAARPDLLAFGFTTSLETTSSKSTSCQRPRFTTYASGANLMCRRNLHVAACTYIFRRNMLGDLRFVPNLKNEDERFSTLLYINAGATIVTDACAYYYRQREGSLQHRVDEAFVSRRLADYASTMFLFHGMSFSDDMKRCAMRRRVSQMTMDYIYNTIMLTRSTHSLEEAIEGLKANGLFPMPHEHYTVKYMIFSRLANSSLGRMLLLRLLPLLPKEI